MSRPLLQPRQQQQQSLRQEYAEFLVQRIEEYKEQLSRAELLSLADEAVRELEVASAEQLVLTEVLMLEHVDRLIMRQLNLPTFRKWRHRHLKLRQAQQDPEYWGVDPEGLLTELAARLDESDTALVLGEAAISTGLFFAAFHWRVLFIDPTLEAVETAEKRAATEGLSSRFQALVVQLGHWLPDIAPTLVVLEARSLIELDAASRVRALDAFKRITASGGVHCFLPNHTADHMLSPALLRAHYGDWTIQRESRAAQDWVLIFKP